jgi:hypothetical protein
LGHYINLLGFKVWISDMGLCLAKVRVSMEINYFIFLHIIATDYSFLFVYGEAWNSGFLLFFLFLDTANGKKLLDSRENGSLLMGVGSSKVLRGVKN